MTNNKLSKKVIYSIGSLFVFMSLCFTANVYADDRTDVADLEAFYHQIFNTKTTTITTSKPRAIKAKKQTKVKPQKRNKVVSSSNRQKKEQVKDPELVAFYEMVFSKSSNVSVTAVDITSVNVPAVKEINNKPIKEQKTSSISPKIVDRSIISESKKDKSPVNPKNETEISNTKLSKATGLDSVQDTLITESTAEHEYSEPPLNDQSNPIAVEANPTTNNVSHNEDNQGKGILDDNLLYSQTQKTDTAALFKSAFEKKNTKKASSTVSNNNNANINDMASLFAKAFGKKAAIAVPSKVKVDFRINSNTIGECELFSNSSGSFDQISTPNLLELLEEVLKEHVFLRVKDQLGNNKKTQLNSLKQLGISAFYNSTNLSLDVEIKPELKKPQILSLINKRKASVREENRVKAEKVSGFLNAFTNVGLTAGGDQANLSMRLEGSLNINGFVLETSTDYSGENFELGRTSLIYDIPDKLQRFSLGNISTGTRNFQQNFDLDGIRISKEFYLDPSLQISPRGNEPLILNTDSEVELYINNQLIRHFFLNAGVYALQDIGLYNGANNIRIRIKDEFGKITVKTSNQYYDSHLLKPGLSLFAISVGYLSNQQSYSESNIEKLPIFSGYYQRGINKELTLSLDAQFSSENYLLGAETISSIPIGSLGNSFAVSGGKERESGFATSFEFRPNKKQEQFSLDTIRQDLLGLDTRSRGFIDSWSVTGEYRSEDFSMLSAVDQGLTEASQSVDGVDFGNRVFNNNKLRGNLQTNFSLNISEQWHGALNIGAADYYDSDESYYANFSATRRFDNGVRLSIGSRYDTEDEFSMNLQLSIPLSRKKGKKEIDLNVLANSRDNSYETKLSVKPTSFVGKNSLAGSLKHLANEDSKQQLLDITYRNNLFDSTLSAANSKFSGSDKSNQHLKLGFNTALACVGGSCAASYPINDSFALVSGPSNQTQPIALSNSNVRFKYSDGNDTGLPDNYSALISGKDKKAVVRLQSYRTQNINVDEGTLPNGYDSEKTEFSVFPKYHQGFSIKAGGEPASTIDGMLYDAQNKVLGFKGGQWIPVNEGKTVAFFSNKGGRFRVTSIPAGKYKLELFDYPDMEPVHISVPDTKGNTHDIGKLIITTPK